MAKPVLVIEGRNVTSLDAFYNEVDKHLTETWGCSDATPTMSGT